MATAVFDAEAALIERLRSGDEAAFALLLDKYSASLLRLAQAFVRSRAVAEEVVQETWMAVITGIARFERRSSLKTWLFMILTNRAKTRARRERRGIPFSSLAILDDDDEPAVDPGRFLPANHERWPGGWVVHPQAWPVGPELMALHRETMAVVGRALKGLPRAQRIVVGLRDVDGWSADEVCAALDLSQANQRVLLHRGRSRVRAALDTYFAGAESNDLAKGATARPITSATRDVRRPSIGIPATSSRRRARRDVLY